MNTVNSDVEQVAIYPVDNSTARLEISACKLGNFLTAGQSSKVDVIIQDSNKIRSISANLNHLKETKFEGLVEIAFSPWQKYSMDQSLWHGIADALFAFSLSCDFNKLMC